ncbi:MAG: hypothetical protein JRE24_06920 [Deltaproteobacteria bacterium]|nr:hypothetical protein [Deltaproteobacteria bacterium]
MGGIRATLRARTEEEREREVEDWIEYVWSLALEDIRLGHNPFRVRKTDARYEIEVWAHS